MMRNKCQMITLTTEFQRQNPGRNSIDQIRDPTEDETMESRNSKLVTDVNAIKADLALIKSNYVTKHDLSAAQAAIRADLSSYATKNDLAAVQAELRADLALIKSNYTTKDDLAAVQTELRAEITLAKAELRAEIAEAKTTIIMWVVSAIFLAQLIPTLLKKLGV